jgi:hypothetical protein
MTDYSVRHACQWLVAGDGKNPRTCRRRGRFALSQWTWLCRQHHDVAVNLEVEDILPNLVRVGGRPAGEL